jgi:hypothetical protein
MQGRERPCEGNEQGIDHPAVPSGDIDLGLRYLDGTSQAQPQTVDGERMKGFPPDARVDNR